MKIVFLFELILLAALDGSDASCTSTVGVTTCSNENLKRNVPLRVVNYKNFIEFKGGLKEIPAGVFQLIPEVKILQISNNDVKKVEAGAFNALHNLERLSLYDNKLEKIENGLFDGLSKLKVLNLGMNQISEIDELSLSGLNMLVELNLGFNKLEKLPSAINHLVGLKVLHLNNNKLKTIESGAFVNLNQLQVLNLNDNIITKIKTGAFSGLINLKELNLQSNYLDEFNTRDVLEGARTLKKIKLAINSFKCQILEDVVTAFERKNVDVVEGISKKKDNIKGIACKN